MPQATKPISTACPKTGPTAGRVPLIFTPAAKATMLPMARTSATIAAAVTQGGRSPGASGSSAARARSLRSSERLDMGRHQRRPLGAGSGDVRHVAGVDPADGEEGPLARHLGGVAHQLEADRRAPRLR